MTWSQDLSTSTIVATGVRAIGWLSAQKPFPEGDVPPEFLAKLQGFVRLANSSGHALSLNAFCGVHECPWCEGVMDSRDFGVLAGALLYVSPGMIAHYVQRHHYLPPAEFISAVMASSLPDTPEYELACAEFRRLHEEADLPPGGIAIG